MKIPLKNTPINYSKSDDLKNIEKQNIETSNKKELIEGFYFSISLIISGMIFLFIFVFFRIEVLTKVVAYTMIFARSFSFGENLNKLNKNGAYLKSIITITNFITALITLYKTFKKPY